MKKYIPVILTAIAALAPVFSPVVQAFYAAHPLVVANLLGAWGIVKYFLPSPLASK